MKNMPLCENTGVFCFVIVYRSKNKTKVLTCHVWQPSKEWVSTNGRSKSGKYLYRLRYQTGERSFADAKELHGLPYCRFRGR
ncbi:hypothetical protein BVG16_20295 [Paenibacillus selenitireducens]|uniref:Transposase DDE domain-containing protein n=1 Tax=Paenibacillus selenitireducens TaxID=1324314 RepID=A0A1T2X776_9BACL|nr:hypothetical protein BVG16_20295 [Paenibacillus selenitireducens]